MDWVLVNKKYKGWPDTAAKKTRQIDLNEQSNLHGIHFNGFAVM